MATTAERTVSEIAIENPASARVFESLGIDYCCGGKIPLRDACFKANVSPESVLRLLDNLKEAVGQTEPEKWVNAPFSELTAHIVSEHHDYVRSDGPRLLALLQKVKARHEWVHPEATTINDIFAALYQELCIHMLKEEQVLFPYLNSMDAAVRAGNAVPPAFFGSVRNPIERMLADHNDAGHSMARISTLSSGYQTPPDGCPTFRALYHGLAEFESNLHRHVHLENNILFPRALEMEKPGK
ncbi:MAG TPA: iron-sulfur cluster repair di-iron protein [Solibacterales bacterium]|nr:iron-sulfur cluster repair di-iron protein [Bryobacterales bacterium]